VSVCDVIGAIRMQIFGVHTGKEHSETLAFRHRHDNVFKENTI